MAVVVANGAPFILAAVLLFSAIAKIAAIDTFSWYITTITFLRADWRDSLTFLVPFVEIAIGCALLLPFGKRLSLMLCIGLLTMFSGYLTAMVIRPSAPSCACLGAIRIANSAAANNRIGLVRNVILLAIALFALRMRNRNQRQP
jgi:hypothetical protein